MIQAGSLQRLELNLNTLNENKIITGIEACPEIRPELIISE
jgi:hypothetical protein